MKQSFANGAINLKLKINKPFKPLDLYKTYLQYCKEKNISFIEHQKKAYLLFT